MCVGEEERVEGLARKVAQALWEGSLEEAVKIRLSLGGEPLHGNTLLRDCGVTADSTLEAEEAGDVAVNVTPLSIYKPFTTEAFRTETGESLAKRIAHQLAEPIDNITLLVGKSKLQEDKVLADMIGWDAGSTQEVFVFVTRPGRIWVQGKFLTGKVVFMDLAEDGTCLSIKQALVNLHIGENIEALRLIAAGRCLVDSDPINTLGMGRACFVVISGK